MPKIIDLTGLRFGRFTAVSLSTQKPPYGRGAMWDCLCDCGTAKTMHGKDLREGKTKSCGCAGVGRPREDITGLRSGRLVALAPVGGVNWNCRCDCGREAVVRTDRLKSQNTKSCGCLPRGPKPKEDFSDLA